MRYFLATVAYETVSPQNTSTQKELNLYCCDDIFPAVSELKKVFIQHHPDKKFVHAWWREIRLSEIPVTELIHPLCIEKPDTVNSTGNAFISML
jgi:hypothetical protein